MSPRGLGPTETLAGTARFLLSQPSPAPLPKTKSIARGQAAPGTSSTRALRSRSSSLPFILALLGSLEQGLQLSRLSSQHPTHQESC